MCNIKNRVSGLKIVFLVKYNIMKSIKNDMETLFKFDFVISLPRWQ